MSGSGIHQAFLPVIRRFDPDFLATYEPNLLTLYKAGEATKRADALQAALKRDGFDPDEHFERLAEAQHYEWPGLEDKGEVGESLRSHVNPFKEGRDLRLGLIQGDHKPHWPLAVWDPLVADRPPSDQPIGVPVVNQKDETLGVLVAWLAGAWSPAALARWVEWGNQLIDVPFFDGEASASIDLLHGTRSSYGLSDSMEEATNKAGRSLVQILPRSLTLCEANVYTFGRASASSPIIVVGEELTDFLLFAALSSVFLPVFWLPNDVLRVTTWTKVPRRLYPQAVLHAAERHLDRSTANEIFFTSATLNARQLGRVKATLRNRELIALPGESAVDHLVTELNVSDLVGELQGQALVYEPDPFSTSHAVHTTAEGLSVGELPIPHPVSSKTRSVGEKRWIAEFAFAERHLPPHPNISLNLLTQHPLNRDFARVTQRGDLALWNPHVIIFQPSIAGTLWRTRLARPPEAYKALQLLLEPDYQMRRSDKGRYAELTIGEVGILEWSSRLDNTDFARLAKAVILGKPKRRGRSILLTEARQISDEVTDWLLNSGFAYLGHELKCEHCSYLEVRRLSDLEDAMSCRRCNREITLTRASTDPRFLQHRLVLDELLRLFLEQRSDAVVSAFAMVATSGSVVEYVPEIEIKAQGATEWMEVDLVGFRDGSLFLGEVKTGSDFATRRKRRKLAALIRDITKHIAPVRTVAIHGWTRPFPANVVSDLVRPEYDTEFLRVPTRAWH